MTNHDKYNLPSLSVIKFLVGHRKMLWHYPWFSLIYWAETSHAKPEGIRPEVAKRLWASAIVRGDIVLGDALVPSDPLLKKLDVFPCSVVAGVSSGAFLAAQAENKAPVFAILVTTPIPAGLPLMPPEWAGTVRILWSNGVVTGMPRETLQGWAAKSLATALVTTEIAFDDFAAKYGCMLPSEASVYEMEEERDDPGANESDAPLDSDDAPLLAGDGDDVAEDAPAAPPTAPPRKRTRGAAGGSVDDAVPVLQKKAPRKRSRAADDEGAQDKKKKARRSTGGSKAKKGGDEVGNTDFSDADTAGITVTRGKV